MAHKKGEGSVKNGRDSQSKRLGVKIFGGQPATCRKYYCSSTRNCLSSGKKCRCWKRLYIVCNY